MFGNYWYNQTLKRNIELFEFLFKDIKIERATSDGSRTQVQTVPIMYAGYSEKYIEQKEADPDLQRSIAIQLPAMAFDIINMARDETRQLAPLNRIYNSTGPGSADVRYVPVPYNLIFQLYIKARNTEDAFKIVEQIIPFFAPTLAVKAALQDGQPAYPINITLNNSEKVVSNQEGIIADFRDLQWVMTFTVSTWMFGPNLNSGAGANGVPGGPVTPIIRWVNTTMATAAATDNVFAYEAITNTYIYEANTAIGDIQPTDDYIIVMDNMDQFALG